MKSIDKNKGICQEYKTAPMSVEQKERDKSTLNKEIPENNGNNNSIIYNSKNSNLTNIYNCKIKNINNKNNSKIKNNNSIEIKPRSGHIIITNREEKINFNFNNGLSHRKITKEYHDGKYEGYIINNKRELKGIIYYKNGSKYEGTMEK